MEREGGREGERERERERDRQGDVKVELNALVWYYIAYPAAHSHLAHAVEATPLASF